MKKIEPIINSFSAETHGLVIKEKIKVQAEIQNWLKKKAQLDKKIKNQYKSLSKIEYLGRASSSGKGDYDISSSNLRRLYQRYSEQKRHISEIRNMDEISDYYKNGYRMIHKIREDLTGQEIKYTVLFKDSQENIMEAHLNLDDILTASNLNYGAVKNIDTKKELSDFSNLTITNAGVKRIINEKIEKNIDELNNIVSQLKKPLLWDSLTFAHKEGENFGRIYEVYNILTKIDRYQKINYIGKRTEALERALFKNAHADRIPGWQAGDIGLEQLKAVFNAAAGLMNISTIEKVLKLISNALDNTNKDDIVNSLTSIFTTQEEHFNNRIDEEAEKQAIENIKKYVLENLTD